MTGWYLDNYWYLLLLLLLPAVGFLLLRFVKWKENSRNIFAEDRFREGLFEEPKRFSKLFPALYFLGMLFLIFALIDLLNGKEEIKTNQKFANVIFVMDVSNSMNAEDIQPNRLSEAKNIMAGVMQKLTRDKVGIVVFAGEANSIMPLTTDYTAANTYIEAIETSVIKTQGTDFLKAVQVAAQKFKNVPKGSRQIVLLSDGEDNEGHEEDALKLAKSEGIVINAIGIGTAEGAPVPEYTYGQLMGYKLDAMGQTVISKRQTGALENLASGSGGTYTDGNNLDAAIQQVLAAVSRAKSSTTAVVNSQNAEHYYQYFLAVSLLIFLMIYLFNPKRDLNI